MADPPLVGVRVQGDELRDTGLGEIDRGRGRWFTVGDLVDATAQAVHAGGVVTFSGVAPIEDKHAPVRPVGEFLAAKPRVARDEEVWAVTGDVAGALALEDLGVGAAAVEVERVKLIAKRGGPVVAEVDHHAHMGVTPAVSVGGTIAGLFPILIRVEVPVVGVQIDETVRVGVGIKRMRAHVVLAGCVVPEVAVDRVDEKQFAVRVPVVAPRVGGAGAEDLDDFALRMITPDRAAHGDAGSGGRTRCPELAGGRSSATSIEPTVRPEAETIGEAVVILVGQVEAIEHDLGRTIGDAVVVVIGDKEELRWAHRPHPTRDGGDAGEALEIVGEHPP